MEIMKSLTVEMYNNLLENNKKCSLNQCVGQFATGHFTTLQLTTRQMETPYNTQLTEQACVAVWYSLWWDTHRHTLMHARTHAHMHACTQAHKHTHTHTHTHTHIYSLGGCLLRVSAIDHWVMVTGDEMSWVIVWGVVNCPEVNCPHSE